MDEPDTVLTSIGLTVQLIGFVTLIGYGAGLYRSSLRRAELRKARYPLGVKDPPPVNRAMINRLRTEAAEPDSPTPDDLPILQAAAETLESRRIHRWGCAGMIIAQSGSLLANPAPIRFALWAAWVVVLLIVIVMIMRNARTAETFLHRHPMPAPADPRS